ncbi:MAG: calcium/sodium antiporter [Faecalibacterium sp.]
MDFSSLALPFLIFIFLLGLFLIVKGGDVFVDAASLIAAKSGIPTFIIGATIVSLATTLPELLVSVFATLHGSAEMAVGNAIGSVTANTGLILAISLLAMPSAAPRKTFCAKGLLLLATITTLFLATRSGVLLPSGQIVLWLLLLAFLAENIYATRSCNNTQSGDCPLLAGNSQSETAPTNSTDAQAHASEKNILARNILLFLLGAAGIAAGSQLLVASATELAVRLCVPEVVIAVTIVAIGTALPELVTALTAIAKKEAGLSAGNILGANIIDTALILPLCSLLNGGGISINAQSLIYDIPVCLLCIAIAVLPTLFTQKFQRWQGGVMLIIYLVYLALVAL